MHSNPPNTIKETLNAQYEQNDEGEIQLNNYVLEEELGKGSFGTVFRGRDTNDGRPVAIKVFSKTRLRKQHLQANGFGRMIGRGGMRGRGGLRGGMMRGPSNPIDFVRGEIAILKKLNHRNIVKLFEVLDDPNGDGLYMVYECCEKGTVMNISLNKKAETFDEEMCRYYFREMFLGIEYLHENDIAHRDIKPDNLLLSADGTLKIVDFGVSEMFSSGDDMSKKSSGSPAFFAPELCEVQHGELSAKACDIWAMGVTLYCFAFGRLPFEGISIIELYDLIQHKPIEIPSGMSDSFNDILLKMLERNPEKRITIAGIREHPWLTRNGIDPLPLKEENCTNVIELITEDDLQGAVRNINNLFTVIKAVSKLKQLRKLSKPEPYNPNAGAEKKN